MRHEKLQAVVAGSTFPSQKCKKIDRFGPLFDVQMWKKCMQLWRKTHFQVESVKKLQGSDHFVTFRCRKKCTLTKT